MKSALNGLSLGHYITKKLKKDHQRISRLRTYENQYNWKRLEFQVSIKKIDKKHQGDIFLKVDVGYPKELHENHSELSFLAERMKIRRGGKSSTKSQRQKGICGTHQTTGSSIKAWPKIKKGTPGY